MLYLIKDLENSGEFVNYDYFENYDCSESHLVES